MSVGRKLKQRRASLEPIDRLFRAGTSAGLSDGQLLERFATRHDEAAEAAFEALVRRHGPMVLSVCRRVLSDPNDAHDAFQATFLVLVRKAATVRNRDSLPSWLYGVARRVSANARAASIRRSVVERSASAVRLTEYESKPLDREILEEVDRLPGQLRSLVVLCYLEGLTHEQASAKLRWPVGTVRSRLSRAREILRNRLTRRGLAPTSGLVPMLVFPPPGLPTRVVEQTIQAALWFAAKDAVEAGLVSASAAALSEGVIRIMFVSKLKTAALALFAAGVVASSAGVYAYQDLVPTPPGIPRYVLVADGRGDDAVPAKRLSDREYETWRHELADRYKTKMQALVDETSRHLLDDHLDKAATSTQAIEATAREWRWMLSHPGAKSMPKDAVRDDVLRTPQSDVNFYVPSRSGNDQVLPRVAAARAVGRTEAVPPTPPRALAAPHATPAPAPVPFPPPTPSAAPLAPVPPAPPSATPPPASADQPTPAPPPPPMPAPPGGDRRLDELERKVDRILKALEQLRGQSSSSRSSSRTEASPYSNSDPLAAPTAVEGDARIAKP